MAEHDFRLIKPMVPRPAPGLSESETRLLWKISHLITSTTSQDDVVQTALDGVIKSVDCDVALFFLRSADELQLRAMSQSSSHINMDRAMTHRVGECLCGVAARAAEPVYSFDICCDPRCTFQECKDAGMRSFAALPLKEEAGVFGILGLASSVPREFANQASFLETLAAVISIGFKNSLQNEQLRQRAAELEQEISERNRAQSAERRIEAQMRSFVHDAPYGVSRAAVHGNRFLNMNPAIVKMLGYDSEQELYALQLARDLYWDPQGRREFLDRLPPSGKFSGVETQWKRKDGKPITVRASGRIVRDPQLAGDAVVEGIFEDVTQQRLLEEQLRQAQKMEVMGRLASGVAHDFNNLLGVILGYCGLLCDELPADSPVLKRIQPIRSAAEQATSLTAQLLAFNRRQSVQSKVLDLNQVISETLKILRRLIGEDIELKLELHPELWKTRADASQIVQVVMNLAVNARDAMPGIGILSLHTSNAELHSPYKVGDVTIPPGRYVLLAVKDTGIGMDAATKARIFEPFFTTKAEGKGTGLGLATVQNIVTQAGGFILAQSEVAKGTTFKIYLPWVESEVEAAAVKQGADATHGYETIVLVEDTIALREILHEGLRAFGYKVFVAANSDNALDIAKNYDGRIDLLLTDVVMPLMSGPDLARQFAILRPETRVLFMSGYIDDAMTKLGPGDAKPEFIQKPFGLVDLGKKLRDMLAAPVHPPEP
jgi:PAS domain S-box-containing protein